MTPIEPALGDMRLCPVPQLYLLVEGEATWRDARWEQRELSRLCSRRGMEVTEVPMLVPVLAEDEYLIETATRVIGIRKGRT